MKEELGTNKMNIVISNPIISVEHLIGSENYIQTSERYLPQLLRNVGYCNYSNSWFRKNKPQYNITLNKLDCIEFRLTKKMEMVYIIVGE